MAQKLKILAISYLYPNCIYPNYGVFVHNRLEAINKYCEIKVINPIPWFPFFYLFKRYKGFERIPKEEVIDGVRVYHPRFFIIPRLLKFLDAFTFCFAVLPLAFQMKKKADFDLIDLHWTYPDVLSGRLLSIFFKKKQLITIRGKEALNLFAQNVHDRDKKCQQSIYKKEYSLRNIILSVLLPYSDAVIALSYELKKICIRNGVEPKKIKVIHNGINSDVFYYMEKNLCRSKLKLRQNELIILSVGSLIFGKGFDRVIKILPQIMQKFPNAHLYIVGSEGPAGDYRAQLDELVNIYNLGNRVHFPGQIANKDLVYWYNAADLFCLPSRSEGSPNVLLEALACGCPSISTDVGSVSEIINSDCLGCIVSNDGEKLLPGILSVLGNKYDRKRISEHMKQYSWDACANRVIKIYKQLL